MSSLELSCESSAVSRNTYVPASLKAALVTAALAFEKVTTPGPLTLAHTLVRLPPAGSPSSLTLPLRLATFGRVICLSGPAFVVGA